MQISVTPFWHPAYSRYGYSYICPSYQRDRLLSVYITNAGHWILDLGNKICTFGEYIPETQPVFHLRVKCLDEDQFLYTYLDFVLEPVTGSQPGGGSVYFHGVGPYTITLDHNDTWCLKRWGTQDKLLCTKSRSLPVGPLSWKDENDICTQLHIESGLQLAPTGVMLTKCSPDHFTCRDNQCVPLEKVCNSENDCIDGGDEIDCFTAHPLATYISTSPPQIPLPFQVDVSIRTADVDLMNAAVRANLRLRISWEDAQMEMRHLQNVYKRLTLYNTTLWSPNVQTFNSLEFATTASPPAILAKRLSPGKRVDGEYLSFPGHGNPVVNIIDLHTHTYCRYDLLKYPDDIQTCNITFQILNVRQDGLKWELPSSSEVKCPVFHEEFWVKDCRFLLPDNFSSRFFVQLTFRRKNAYHIWATYLPCILLLGIGYGTLLLPLDNFNERGTMSLTTLLVFISLYAQTTASLPRTAYLKRIDLWYVFCIAFLTLVIFTNLATSTTTNTRGTTAEGPFWWHPSGPEEQRNEAWSSKKLPNSSTQQQQQQQEQERHEESRRKRKELVLKTASVVLGVSSLIFIIVYFTGAYITM
ncbi:hypothetical protein Pcinc_001963 [Petrolisthes cinctipes]|uniref:Uncharacterized protein n=1 Tax=Petrolisthes cinctipes TaxID=88211 RepID=A0AAE1GJP6_PETCI|nr:hypothetical protein Pcinc_001963 [Petrolisthes cinctipes]